MTRGTAAIAMAGLAVVLAVAVALIMVERGGGQRGSGMPDIGGPFELVDHTGQTVNEQSWPGQHLLIYFGYTFCPDVCPTELQIMTVALDELGGEAERIQPLFVTVDPARDTVPAMADYVGAFHARMVGLTGSDQQIRAAARTYRVYFALGEGEDYLVDHSSFIYLMSPDGQLLTYFPANSDPTAMAGRIAELL